jgi:hypothetical protein
MARGNSRAQSEAGEIKRSETPGRRIRDAVEQLKNTISGSSREDARDILTKPRGNDERYTIDMGDGREDDKMTQAGKINLIEATIDGKPIGQGDRGAVDQMGVKSTNNYNVPYVKEMVNQEKGYVFATDGKQVYALPHSWDKNDPAGTVGIFKGDIIKVNGKELNVIGSFDASRRGLQAASLAAGDAIGRDKGVKQTAILLTYTKTKEYGRGIQEDTRPSSVFGGRTIDTLNKGLSDLGAKKDGVEPYRG